MPRNTLAAFDLRAARKLRGMSQVAVAQILCTTQPSVARWEAQGNMPEVFRKVWDLHWQLADGADVSIAKIERKHGALRASKRKTNVSDVSSGNSKSTGAKANDSRSNKRNRKLGPRGRKVVSSKTRNDRSDEGSQVSGTTGATESAEPIREA